MALKTNYKDDVLNATMNGKRRYRKTDYSDGTFSLEDVTTYDQVGDDFAAKDVNEINKEVNTKFDSGDVVDPMLATEGGFAADALATKKAVDELNSKLTASDNTPFRFGKNEKGEYGYIVEQDGADTVIPFRNSKGMEYDLIHNFSKDLWITTSGTMNTAMFRGTFSGQTKLIDVTKYNTLKVRGFIGDYSGFYPGGYISISTDGSTWIDVYRYSSSNKNTYWDISYDISELNAIYVKIYAYQANNCKCIYSSIALSA